MGTRQLVSGSVSDGSEVQGVSSCGCASSKHPRGPGGRQELSLVLLVWVQPVRFAEYMALSTGVEDLPRPAQSLKQVVSRSL
jgi:hypothetical protein